MLLACTCAQHVRIAVNHNMSKATSAPTLVPRAARVSQLHAPTVLSAHRTGKEDM